jgi:hypothetical protein
VDGDDNLKPGNESNNCSLTWWSRLSMAASSMRQLSSGAPRKRGIPIYRGEAVAIIEREPWGEAVDGAEVLDGIIATVRKHIILKDDEVVMVALWVVASYAFEEFFIFPRLRIKSPMKGCGKSTLMDILECLVNRPHKSDNGTVATLFRIIARDKPTELLDETDTWLKDDKDGSLKGIINAGHKKNGMVDRCVGDDQEVRSFPVYCPMVLAGIGKLPGTIEERSIMVLL